jgi:hypothetical protein
MVEMAIPAELSKREPARSDSRPANGAKSIMITGLTTSSTSCFRCAKVPPLYQVEKHQQALKQGADVQKDRTARGRPEQAVSDESQNQRRLRMAQLPSV